MYIYTEKNYQWLCLHEPTQKARYELFNYNKRIEYKQTNIKKNNIETIQPIKLSLPKLEWIVTGRILDQILLRNLEFKIKIQQWNK